MLLACLLSPPSLTAQVKLAWTLADDDVFFVEEIVKVSQKLHARTELFEMGYKHTKLSRFRVVAKNEDGSLLLEQEILKVKPESSGRNSPKVPDAVARKLEGSKLQFTLDARQQITKLEGHDKLIERLGGNATAVLQQALTPESLRANVEMLFAFVPGKEVAAGDSWQSATVFPFGPLGKFDCKNTCTLKDAKQPPEEAGKETAIDVQSKWQFAAAPREQLKQMRLTGVAVTSQKSSGQVLFDAAAGRVAKSSLNYTILGYMTLDLPNSADMNFEQQGEIVLHVAATMPEEK